MNAKKQLLVIVTNFYMLDISNTRVPWLIKRIKIMHRSPLKMQIIISFIAISIFLLIIQVSEIDIIKAMKLNKN